jgi:hypothetical protein
MQQVLGIAQSIVTITAVHEGVGKHDYALTSGALNQVGMVIIRHDQEFANTNHFIVHVCC